VSAIVVIRSTLLAKNAPPDMMGAWAQGTVANPRPSGNDHQTGEEFDLEII
jgi:hypothetical protein